MTVNSKPSVGIIGGGFVGSSFAAGFKGHVDVKLFDINPDRSTHGYEEVITQDILVLALNTPMVLETGEVDVSVVESVLRQLNGDLPKQSKPVIVKSTVPPEPLLRWSAAYRNLEIIFCPEFLREKTAQEDFDNSNRVILGSSTTYIKRLEEVELLFATRFPGVPIIWTSYEEASLIKYFTNVYFCAKIALLNEFAQVCEKYGLEFNSVFSKVMLDERIGRSHFKIPGPDGKKGFGGHCFPKDINGYLNIAMEVGVDPIVSESAWIKNLEVRPERDWEQDIGRAVSKR